MTAVTDLNPAACWDCAVEPPCQDYDGLVPVTAAGQLTRFWRDLTGHGNHWQQNAAGEIPTSEVGDGGFFAIKFNGSESADRQKMTILNPTGLESDVYTFILKLTPRRNSSDYNTKGFILTKRSDTTTPWTTGDNEYKVMISIGMVESLRMELYPSCQSLNPAVRDVQQVFVAQTGPRNTADLHWPVEDTGTTQVVLYDRGGNPYRPRPYSPKSSAGYTWVLGGLRLFNSPYPGNFSIQMAAIFTRLLTHGEVRQIL